MRYRWRLGKREDWGRLGSGDRVVIEAEMAHGSTLIANLHYDWNWDYSQPAITPKHVAEWILEALAGGWKPLESGPPFQLGENLRTNRGLA